MQKIFLDSFNISRVRGPSSEATEPQSGLYIFFEFSSFLGSIDCRIPLQKQIFALFALFPIFPRFYDSTDLDRILESDRSEVRILGSSHVVRC